MTIYITTKEETIDKIEKTLKKKLTNKELYETIFNLFTKIINKPKIKLNTSPVEIEVTDITHENGEKISVQYLPEQDNYDAIKILYNKGLLHRKTFTISFNNNNVSVTIEENEFLFKNKQLTGLIYSKTSRQYNNNKLTFTHEYITNTYINDNISESIDTLIQTNEEGKGIKRTVKINENNEYSIDHYISDDFEKEIFNTFNSTYTPATFTKTAKEKYEKQIKLNK